MIEEKERCFHFKALVRIHTRESLHLEKKNMLRTFLGLKLKQLRTSKGFLQF